MLYHTSQGWAYIDTVYILLPASWTNVTEALPGQSVHEEAEVRVEPTSPLYGDTPFTLQPGDCGEQAEFIQVSSTTPYSTVQHSISINDFRCRTSS